MLNGTDDEEDEMAKDKGTHVAKGKTFEFGCTPVASHLNHDGKGNGITRVKREDGKVTDVGTKTLRER